MNSNPRPESRPGNPCFSSGPTAKRPGWTPAVLSDAFLGRSHRSEEGYGKLRECIALMRATLGLPDDYLIGITPGSASGAMEMALWSLLGARGVDVFSFDAFGQRWLRDITKQLRHDDTRVFEAEYGALPDLNKYDPSRDCVITWNATASGVRVPHGDWIPLKRDGLVIADCTSAAFAMPLPFDRIDALTFSWQKALGGEGGHGVIVLSPRAIERLENHTPPWPVPHVFSLTKNGALSRDFFNGKVVNTPSMLCVEDAIDALNWARGLGGGAELLARVERNFAVLHDWVQASDDFAFCAHDPATVSPVSPTLRLKTKGDHAAIIDSMTTRLEAEGIAFDIKGYALAPPGLRIWCGPTVETADMESLLPWLDWALAEAVSPQSGA